MESGKRGCEHKSQKNNKEIRKTIYQKIVERKRKKESERITIAM